MPSPSQGSGCSTWRPSDDGLREHAVLVADAVAEGRQAQRGHRIQEAGRQPAQAAVAQGGIGLVLLDVFQPLRAVAPGRLRPGPAGPAPPAHCPACGPSGTPSTGSTRGAACRACAACVPTQRCDSCSRATWATPAIRSAGEASAGATPTWSSNCRASSAPQGVHVSEAHGESGSVEGVLGGCAVSVAALAAGRPGALRVWPGSVAKLHLLDNSAMSAFAEDAPRGTGPMNSN